MATRQATKRRKERKAGSPRKSPKTRPGAGGDKRSKAQIENFLEQVRDMLTRGMGNGAIADELEAKGVGRSTTDAYIAQVHERWQADAVAAAPHVREQRIARLTMLSEETRSKREYAACARFESMLNDIQGVRAPLVVVPVPAGAAAPLDLAQCDDDELAVLRRIAEKRIKALPSNVVGDTTVVEGKAS